jgi:hypothetical protein
MLVDFLKVNHFEIPTATVPWLWEAKVLACCCERGVSEVWLAWVGNVPKFEHQGRGLQPRPSWEGGTQDPLSSVRTKGEPVR